MAILIRLINFIQIRTQEMNKLNDNIAFPCGISMKNRFMLAPLTNTQSFEDGTLSDDEFLWLTLRAKGNFGLTMSCASMFKK